jgi:hypothetical protein
MEWQRKETAMRRSTMFVLAVSVWASSTGCGTLFASGPDAVPVSSTPSGAKVTLDGQPCGTTPTVVAVPRGSEGVFRFELEGFERMTVDRDKVLNGVTFFNMLGGYITIPLFYLIDIVTGNIGKYSTNPLHVELVPRRK